MESRIKIKKLSSEYGTLWIKVAWRLLRENFWMTSTYMLVVVTLGVVLGLIPVIGVPAAAVVQIIIFCGGINAFDKWYKNEEAVLDDFLIFLKDIELRKRFAPFLILTFIVNLLVNFVTAGASFLALVSTSNQSDPTVIAGSGGALFIIFLFISFCYGILAYFVTPIMFFNNISIKEAFKLSFELGLKNWLPLTITGILTFLMFLFGMIPLGLGAIATLLIGAFFPFLMYISMFDQSVDLLSDYNNLQK